MKRISGRQGLSVFVFISLCDFIHSIFVDDLWNVLLSTGMLIIFITSYFHSDVMETEISSFKQLLQLELEMDVVPVLLLRIGYLLAICGGLGSIYVE